MNCANHADASAVAYCRTCGKALCANCTRPVRGVIYCEDCLGARMATPAPSTVYQQGMDQGFGVKVPPPVLPPMPPIPGQSGPNPTVAGILAGFFPFGVGAVYTGQYAKGLAHLGIFGLLIAAANAADNHGSDALEAIAILGLVFFVVYQIIDAVRSARAIQVGMPPPDPYGLSATFGGGAKIETSKVPMGAIILILVGVLFLLHTLGLTEFGLDRFWPLILIVLGGWMFARNWGLFCSRLGCQCSRCRTRRAMGPAIVFTIGVLFLLENLHVDRLGFGHTWPVILLVIGVVKLLQGNASTEGHIPLAEQLADVKARFRDAVHEGGAPTPPVPPVPPAPPVPPNDEVNRG